MASHRLNTLIWMEPTPQITAVFTEGNKSVTLNTTAYDALITRLLDPVTGMGRKHWRFPAAAGRLIHACHTVLNNATSPVCYFV